MNRILVLGKDRTLLSAYGRTIPCSSLVRNELGDGDMYRKSSEVVLTEPAPGHPYMPRPFPKGTWDIDIEKIEKRGDESSYVMWWWIPIKAHQPAEVWIAEERESTMVYVRPTGKFVEDSCFGSHGSSSPTTLGCIRIGKSIYHATQDQIAEYNEKAKIDIDFWVDRLLNDHADGNSVQLEVI